MQNQTPQLHRSMSPIEWSLLLVLSVLWGGSFFFVGVAVRALPPFTLVAARVGLAALVLHAVVLATGQRMPAQRRIWAAFFGMGLINNVVPFCLLVWSQKHIASGLAAILNATTPIFTVIVAHFLTSDEKLSGNRLVGVLSGFAGVVLMIGPAALDGFGTGVLAQLAVLGTACSYAFAGIFGRRFVSMGVAPMLTATGQVTASTIMLLPIALLVDRPWTLPAPGVEVFAAIAGLAVLSTALGYILYFRILATAGATNLLLVTFLIPVSAILLGVTILGERLEARQLAGMGAIAIGLAAIDGRLVRRLRGRDRRRDQSAS